MIPQGDGLMTTRTNHRTPIEPMIMNRTIVYTVSLVITVACIVLSLSGCGQDTSQSRSSGVDSVETDRYIVKARLMSGKDSSTGVMLDVVPRYQVHDALMNEASSHGEYAALEAKASFELHEGMELIIDGRTVSCIGSIMEHDVGLRSAKRFLLTFPVTKAELGKASSVRLRWSDTIFKTGISVFVLK